jgi:hypothetical protein
MLAQKQPSFKECVIAHQSSDSAPKMIGTEVHHRSFESFTFGWMVVGERSMVGRSCAVRHGGRDGSDYAGMSNDKAGEKPAHRKPKVS